MGKSPEFGPPTNLEEEHQLVLERSRYMLEHIADQEQRLEVDRLTGAKSLAAFESVLEQSLKKLQGHRKGEEALEEVALISFDLDHFKDVNDTYGHAMGDEVLKKVVATVGGLVRASDHVARVGGEEFMVLLPGATLEFAARDAEKFRVAIEQIAFDTDPKLPTLTIKASFGVNSSKTSTDAATLRKGADQALYDAKNAGRNQVAVYKQESET